MAYRLPQRNYLTVHKAPEQAMAMRNTDKMKVAHICLSAIHGQIDPVAQEKMISDKGVGNELAKNIRVRIDCNLPGN
jgi:hypothetical protein